MYSRLTTGTFVAGLIVAGIISAEPPRPAPTKPLSQGEVTAFIRQLGDDDFRTREEATAALKRRPEAALALLRADRKAADPEVKRRLAAILPAMMSQSAAEKRLAKLPDYIKDRQLDRVVETMVACRQFVATKHRDLVLGFANELFAGAIKIAKKEMPAPHLCWLHTGFVIQDGNTEDAEITTTSIVRHSAGKSDSRLVIASDRFENLGGVSGGIMIGNGELRIDSTSGKSLIVTTGDVTGATVDRSVILCGGDFKLKLWMNNSVVMAGGTIRYFDEPRASKENVCRERDRSMIGTWKLYSATEAGATLGSIFGVVWVQEVAPDSPFAKAGIKPGDMITAVDHTYIHTIRDATRLLCRATVSWGATDLSIRRGEEKRDAIVTLHEW